MMLQGAASWPGYPHIAASPVMLTSLSALLPGTHPSNADGNHFTSNITPDAALTQLAARQIQYNHHSKILTMTVLFYQSFSL